MSSINEYVRSIAFYLIFMAFTGIILPEGKYKKYINVILGLILIIILLSPIFKLIKADNFNVDELFDPLEASAEATSSNSDYERLRDKAIIDGYLDALETQTASIIQDSIYRLNDISADFDMDTGEIRSIRLKVQMKENAKDGKEGEEVKKRFIRIEPIKINNDTVVNNEDEIPEIAEMKKTISYFYNIPVDNIYIEIAEAR